jgi:hypothetical protein
LLGDLSEKVVREEIYRSTVMNERLHATSDNEVSVVMFATLKNLIVRCTMFPYCNIHKYTWTFPGGKTHSQIDYALIDWKWH